MAGSVAPEFAHIINGKAVFSERTAAIVNPATGQHLADVPIASEQQLDDAVDAAQEAFPAWASKTYEQRANVLLEMANIIETRADDYKRLLTAEQGKPYREAFLEIMGSAHFLREASRLRIPETVHEDTPSRKVISQHVPLGVTVAIVPWNFPILLAAWKIGPALLAGNTVLVKPSPWTPLTTLRIVADLQCVLPDGVLSVLSADDQLASSITAHPKIKRAIPTGKKVMQNASLHLKRITLELGGNDPMIILPSVDPATIAHTFAKPSPEQRPILHRRFDKLRDIFEDTKTRGCKFALGGDFPENHEPDAGKTDHRGLFVPVTIVDNPPEDSRIVQEEQFGPILPLLSWKDEWDVVRRANGTPYGLGASVWGDDLTQAARIASQMEAGNIWINEIHTFGPTIPGGGHKQSGIGVENGIEGLSEWTNIQTVSMNKAGITPM
ncbi:Aldehyde dehydrogenase [Ceratobasidium theobromae]|uniref:Aldehyde dehydrogenase n=1 Tax=Ceratobasidium theobromae TaxID=1582974 RepID=A0A5N5QQT8_9AGAM|nr:Aldehyde dehydrogenase [Ceratobasidium theobromae]